MRAPEVLEVEMPFQPVPNTARVDAIFSCAGERSQFSFHCNNDTEPWDATQLTALGDAVRDAIVADYIPVLSVDHSYLGWRARDLEVQFGRVEEVFEPAPIAGTLASPSLPNHVSVIGTLKSATGAPRRGRVNLLAPTEGQVTANSLLGAAQAALQGALQSIHNAIDGVSLNAAHVIVSRFSGTELRVDYPTQGETTRVPNQRDGQAIVANVATVQVQTRLGSMRSRRPRAA